jgi:hypothetical protein
MGMVIFLQSLSANMAIINAIKLAHISLSVFLKIHLMWHIKYILVKISSFDFLFIDYGCEEK